VGKNGAEFTELLSLVIKKRTGDTVALTEQLVAVLQQTLTSQNALLSNHPNAYIYNALANLVDFDGFYLESEPCLVCNDPEIPYHQAKLETLTTQSKFTDSTQVIKLNGSYMIKQVIVLVNNDTKKAKMLRTLNLYCNNKPVSDIGELKNKWAAWKKVKSVDLSPGQTELRIEFPLPIVACNILIEYSSFYENLGALERLQCPRCNRVVTDKVL
jgi:E3 ubiquitin-protein ligase UBR4